MTPPSQGVPSSPDPMSDVLNEKLQALMQGSEQEWLTEARLQVMQGNTEDAFALFLAAALRFPVSREVRLGLAGLCWQLKRLDQAETLLREWLAIHSADEAATFLLVRLLREQGRMQAAGKAMLTWAAHGPHDVDAIIQAVEMLDDFSQPGYAAMICEAEIAAGCIDPRIHAYAGMLAIQLGAFDRTRERYDFALRHHAQAVEWNIPIGLSGLQRYLDDQHPDFPLFRSVLDRQDINDRTRMTTLFALGKAYDDIGDHAKSIDCLRRANAMGHAQSAWSREAWKRSIKARLASSPYPFHGPVAADWTPVFIVGMPRSGTTLLAELISRHPLACNRGELGWLQTIAQRLVNAGSDQQMLVREQADLYAAQLRQDDSDARWFIDKQPMNFLHVDLIMALWPNARIIYCQRHPRDTALSLWMQTFHDHAHDYAYDFGDIAAAIHGCRRLMAHWCKLYPTSIHALAYEDLVATPGAVIESVMQWLGLPITSPHEADLPGHAISTASAWQARQPVYTRSIGRWRDYIALLPELANIPER